MLEKEDYVEPTCPLCATDPAREQAGSISMPAVTAKLDELFSRNDLTQARRVLDYWLAEARMLRDERGELGVLNEQIGLSRRIQDKKLAVDSIERALELLAKSPAPSVSRATIRLNAATTYKAFGFLSEALAQYELVHEQYAALLEPDDALIGALYNNHALALTEAGRFDEALSLYKQALVIMEKQPRGELECAITYTNMADLYAEAGEDDKVGPAMEKAYALLTLPETERDGYYAFVCEKCAAAFAYHGYFLYKNELNARAEAVYERDRTV
ncbi:MAG: tetratricopeptide repeat protein [Eubacteriales bacterium]|nr:tetratricopeptide repeat protein [Eubacteriales bacterium]